MLLFYLVPLIALLLRVSPADLLGNLVDPQVAQAIQVEHDDHPHRHGS